MTREDGRTIPYKFMGNISIDNAKVVPSANKSNN